MSWGKGGEGAIELAEKVSAVVVERKNRFKPLYQMDWSIEKKIETVAKKSMAPKP
jgi:formate--tetrahydrofolate ligase